ncbi:hypothetical protein BDK51DRAFT_28162 [Blyttiomyces helicus]|uniref:IGFBP N-terminal domain-containing protein n=1 Tax=Blyttiomyces helicus TaxID=388810 RepID=A0A4P9WBZ2_9FUNG|nr:hypothetical protein BDK51DRAFT_28162 [Blyttiomyces helicus]|eukprot:RKO89812.1 hypothetical protein BDK51DRAFT_28162 [Blyttiomyces helicus]
MHNAAALIAAVISRTVLASQLTGIHLGGACSPSRCADSLTCRLAGPADGLQLGICDYTKVPSGAACGGHFEKKTPALCASKDDVCTVVRKTPNGKGECVTHLTGLGSKCNVDGTSQCQPGTYCVPTGIVGGGGTCQKILLSEPPPQLNPSSADICATGASILP